MTRRRPSSRRAENRLSARRLCGQRPHALDETGEIAPLVFLGSAVRSAPHRARDAERGEDLALDVATVHGVENSRRIRWYGRGRRERPGVPTMLGRAARGRLRAPTRVAIDVALSRRSTVAVRFAPDVRWAVAVRSLLLRRRS